MERKKISTVLVLAGLAAEAVLSVLCMVLVPMGTGLLPDLCRDRALTIGCVMTAWAVLSCAVGLFIVICRRIGEGRSFCMENVRDLYRIFLLVAVSSLLTLITCLLCIVSRRVRLYLYLACVLLLLLSLLAWGLSKLVEHAVVLKEENDLTI